VVQDFATIHSSDAATSRHRAGEASEATLGVCPFGMPWVSKQLAEMAMG
jgi:hypothetical protein